MDAKYKQLFILITQTTANLAEEVMNLHAQKDGEEKEYETAQMMRDDYLNLHDKLTDTDELNKADFARILVGAIIVSNQLDNRIKNEQKALYGYKTDIIPKLDQINNATTEEEVAKLVETLFAIKPDEEIKEEE